VQQEHEQGREREQGQGREREREREREHGQERAQEREQEQVLSLGRMPESGPASESPALPTRVRQTSLAPELRTEVPAPDGTSEREVTPEEIRAVFGAFQRGLDRGRKGLPTEPGPAQRTDTEEGTAADDAP
jgi:hypothetical protein